jgi:cyanophycinase
MARFPSLLVPLLLAVASSVSARAADYEYFLTGSPADAKPTRTEGALLLMGGSGDVDDAFRWFVQKAGGGDIVVLRASGGDGYNDYLFSRIGGVDSVETILFRTRAASLDPRVLALIGQADGIWLAGGDQARYVNFWKGTPVAAALDAHVRAGKPLGGTSAGLAVLGEFSFAALGEGSLTSEPALRNPFDARVTLERDFLRFDLLRGVITDSHFTPRARLGRSLVFLARLFEPGRTNRLLGIGVDEKVALAVESDGSARVFAAAPHARVWLLLPTRPAEVLEPGRPLTLREVKVIGLGPESRLNLTQLDVQKPDAVSIVSVVDGILTEKK